jgi:hypothetical protein
MALESWINWLSRKSKTGAHKRQPCPRSPRYRPLLDVLEDRTLPSVSLVVRQWTAQGPGPILNGTAAATPNNDVTGAVESVAVARVQESAQNPGGLVMYAGTVNGGVWRADNASLSEFGAGVGGGGPTIPGGTSNIDWKPLTDQQASLGTTAMALDTTDSLGNTLWVATGSFSSFRGDGANGVGLLLTTNGGQTWSNVGKSLAGSAIFGIVPTHVQQGTNVVPGAIVATNGPGVQYSLDDGQTFNPGKIKATGAPLTGAATDVVADPNNSQRFYAAVAYSTNPSVTNHPGVYVSNDGGQTWTEIDNGRLNLNNPNWIKLAVHNQNGRTILYAGVVGSNLNVSGVYRTTISSTGSPSKWTAIGASSLPAITTTAFHFSLTADPVDANIVYLSGLASPVYRGDALANGGNGSWATLTSSSYPHSDSRSLTFVYPNLLLESDDGGVFGLNNPRTSNGVWHAASANMQATEFFSVSMDPTTGLIAGGSQDNGTSEQASVGGVAWNQVAGNNDGGLTQFASDGALYDTGNMALFRGLSNTQVKMAASSSPGTAYSGLNNPDNNVLTGGLGPQYRSLVYALSPYPGNSQRLLVGLTGLYESTNQGATVTIVTPTGLTGNVTAITYGANNTAYVGTDTGQLWVRTNATATFQQITTWPPSSAGGYAVRIVVDPNEYRIAYVLDTNGKVWQTTNGDQTSASWKDLTDNLDSLAPTATIVQLDDTTFDHVQSPVQTIELYDPTPVSQPGDGVLLAGGLGGVFSLRLGSNDPCWHQLGTGLPNVVVSDLHYSPQQDVLLAGTFGRGAWTISSASFWLGNPTTLSVVALLPANNVIDIRPDPSNNRFLQVVENGVVDYDGPYSYIAELFVFASNPGDTVRLENLPACLPFVIHMTPGQGFNFIESESSGFPGLITVTSSGTADTIHIGDASHSLDTNGTLKIVGDGVANVIVDDSGNLVLPFGSSIYQPTGTQYTIGGGQLTRLATLQLVGPPTSPPVEVFGETINYSGLANLTVASGVFGTYGYQVNSTAGASSVTIKAGSAFDAITVGDGSHNLAAIGALNVQGNGATIVRVDDSGNLPLPASLSVYFPVSTQYVIGGGQLTRTATLVQVAGPPTTPPVFAATINYSGLTSLTVTGGPLGAYTYQVTDTTRTKNLTLSGGSAPGVFSLQGTTAGTSTTVNAGTPSDQIVVGSAANTLDPVQGGITVNGQGSNTTLNILDQGAAGPQLYTYQVSSTQVTRTPSAPGQPLGAPTQTISYSAIANLIVHGSAADGPGSGDGYNVTGTHLSTAVSLYGGAGGGNEFVVGDSLHPLDDIQGALALHGASSSDFVEYFDDGNPSGHMYTLSTPNPTTTLLQRDGIAAITQDGMGALILAVPVVGGNQINVRSVPANVVTNIHTSNGDQDVVGSLAPISQGGNMNAILGTVGFTFEASSVAAPVTLTLDDSNDTSTMPRRVSISPNTPQSGPVLITNLAGNGEVVYWALPSDSSVTVRGRAGGNETFAMQNFPSGQVAPFIAAGGSNNTLDYSAYSGDITVNLSQSTPTATALAGISGIENVTGSIGNDLLVSDANANVLIGGTGRNIIIGGGGLDQLTGGGGDNLLIGGDTIYDQSPSALELLKAEWMQPSDFATRQTALTLGLDLLAGTGIKLDSTTLLPDGLVNLLTPGPGNNWLIS